MQPLTQAKLKVFSSLPDKRMRRKHGMFVAEGFKLLEEALRSGWVPLAVVVQMGTPPGKLPQLPPATELFLATENEFNKLTEQQQPEGVLAVYELPEPMQSLPKQLEGPALLLYDLQDPGNLGTLLRTADWFGFRAVYASVGTADCFNPKVIRAAMGAVFRVPVHYVPDLHLLMQQQAKRIVATSLEAPLLPANPPHGRDCLLLGSESHGVPPHWLKVPGVLPVQIAGYGQAESLNVSVAGGILMHWLKSS
jgi:TrmH family RNA methyltransferase